MGSILAAFGAGIVFGLGLAVSQMVDPAKVLGFLDVLGAWDPSLALVLGGAVAVAFVGYRIALRAEKPLLAEAFALPTRTDIDSPLIVGPAIFGIGWGLVGLCPGPALASFAFLRWESLAFVVAMVAGMLVARRLAAR